MRDNFVSLEVKLLLELHWAHTKLSYYKVNAENNLPTQEEPFFPKPSLQIQIYEPAVFTQSENPGHCVELHSLTSRERARRNCQALVDSS